MLERLVERVHELRAVTPFEEQQRGGGDRMQGLLDIEVSSGDFRSSKFGKIV